MAKKTFEEKQKQYKEKNGISTNEKPSYIPKKTEREKALELLEQKKFKASIKDNTLYCECKNEEEYEKYQTFLLEYFGKDGKVPFSYGGCIKESV